MLHSQTVEIDTCSTKNYTIFILSQRDTNNHADRVTIPHFTYCIQLQLMCDRNPKSVTGD